MRNILLLVLCMLPFLSSCVAAAVFGGAAAGGAIINDKRSFKSINRDANTTQFAQHLIDHSKVLKGKTHIAVSTFDHSLLMAGQAETPELRNYAYKLVKDHVKNVDHIYNEVEIAGPASFSERADDSWLTTKVRTAMLSKKGLSSLQIKVVTESSTVYLMGRVTRKQASLATDVARRVKGVKRVVTLFQYTTPKESA